MNRHAALDMTRGKAAGLMIRFAVPLLIGNLFQQLYNIVDSAVVGNYVGYAALSAVGTCSVPLQVMIAVFLGIGTGATILISQLCGAEDRAALRQAARTANAFLLICAVPLTVLGYFGAGPLLRLIDVPADAFGMARTYLSVLFLGTVANLGYNLNAGILRGMGDSRSPLLFLVVSSLLNVGLDLLFVAVFGWGVAGVAWATVAAQACSWALSIFWIRRYSPELDMPVVSLRMERPLLRRMLGLGLPLGLNNSIDALGHLILQVLINRQGTVFMAGYTAANRIDALIYYTLVAFGAAGTTFAGQNIGALRRDDTPERRRRIDRGLWTILGITLCAYLALAAFILPCGRWLISLFNSDPQVIAAGYMRLRWLVPFYWMYCCFYLFCSYLSGAGMVKMPTVANLLVFWLARLPAAWLLTRAFGANYLHACFPISWLFGMVFTGIYYFRGNWKKKAMPEPPQP